MNSATGFSYLDGYLIVVLLCLPDLDSQCSDLFVGDQLNTVNILFFLCHQCRNIVLCLVDLPCQRIQSTGNLFLLGGLVQDCFFLELVIDILLTHRAFIVISVELQVFIQVFLLLCELDTKFDPLLLLFFDGLNVCLHLSTDRCNAFVQIFLNIPDFFPEFFITHQIFFFGIDFSQILLQNCQTSPRFFQIGLNFTYFISMALDFGLGIFYLFVVPINFTLIVFLFFFQVLLGECQFLILQLHRLCKVIQFSLDGITFSLCNHIHVVKDFKVQDQFNHVPSFRHCQFHERFVVSRAKDDHLFEVFEVGLGIECHAKHVLHQVSLCFLWRGILINQLTVLVYFELLWLHTTNDLPFRGANGQFKLHQELLLVDGVDYLWKVHIRSVRLVKQHVAQCIQQCGLA